jgi:plastocyanin
MARSTGHGHHCCWRSIRIAVVGLSFLLTFSGCGDDGDPNASSTSTSMPSTTMPSAGPGPIAQAASAKPSQAPPGSGAVTIRQFAFNPSPVTVPPGGTVTWTNDDNTAHSISDTSPMATPVSKPLNKGDTFSITYPKPGTYPYVCGIHNYMHGSVEVKG